MELLYLASFLFCCLPLMVAGQDNPIQFEIRIVQVSNNNDEYVAELQESKVLTCEATTSGDLGGQTPTLKWFYEGTEITATSFRDRIRVTQSGSALNLILKDIVDEDGGNYRCEGSLAGQQDTKSVQVVIYKKTEFLSKTEQFGIFGKDGKVECKVEGKPTPVVYWKFMNESDIPNSDKYVIQNEGLTIKSLTLEDDMEYLCFVQVLSRGDIFYFPIDYTVSKPPKIENVVEIKPINAKVGDEVKLTCRAEGVPKPTISFMKEKNMVDDSMVSDGVLTIPSLKIEDEATYMCLANNLGGKANRTAFLDVKIPPQVTITMMSQGDDGDPVEGQVVTVQCEAKGDPQPDIKWKKESEASYYEDGMVDQGPRFESGGGNQRDDEVLKVVSKSMIFDSIRHQDAGTYTCLASNVIADVTEETTISIRYPPDFNTDFKQREFYGWKGHTANLTCQSTANPAPTYRWYQSQPENPGMPGEEITTQGVFTVATQQTWEEYKLSSSSLLIDMTTREDLYGIYVCEASNRLAEGRKTIAVTLKQANPPGRPEVSKGEALTTMVSLRVTPPAQTGGQPVIGYFYEYFPETNRGAKMSGSVDRPEGEAQTTVELRNLQMNTKYVINVQARNNVGLGMRADVIINTLDVSKPLPLKLTSQKEGTSDTAYTLAWEEPQDGEDPITEFHIKYAKVQVKDETSEEWDFDRILGEEKEATVKTSNLRQYTIRNLERDSFYQVKVSAQNGVGNSDWVSKIIKTSKGSDKAQAGSAGLGSGAVIGIILVIIVLILIVVIIIYFVNKRKPELASRLRGKKDGEEERGKKEDGKDQAEAEQLIKKDDTVKVENETGKEVKTDDVVEEKQPEEFDPDTKPASQPEPKDAPPATEVKGTPETPEKPDNPTA